MDGYTISRVACGICGTENHPFQTKCRQCGQDPLQHLGWRSEVQGMSVWLRLFILISAIGMFIFIFATKPEMLKNLLNWVNENSDNPYVLVIVFGSGLLVGLLVGALGRRWYAVWQTTYLVGNQGLHIFQRYQGGARWTYLNWDDVEMPVRGRRWVDGIIAILPTILHIVFPPAQLFMEAIFHVKADLFTLSYRWAPQRSWLLASSSLWYDMCWVGAYCWYRWLQQGEIAIDPDYAPNPQRNLILLDLNTRLVRAYPVHEVNLGLESTHTVQTPEGAQEVTIKAVAVPLGEGYWFSADWGIHKRVKTVEPSQV